MQNTEPLPRVLRLREVLAITGLAKPTIYWQIARDRFPRPIQLGAKSVGWLESDLRAWLQVRIDARDTVGA